MKKCSICEITDKDEKHFIQCPRHDDIVCECCIVFCDSKKEYICIQCEYNCHSCYDTESDTDTN